MPVICQIMCDSTCDLSAERARELGVRVIPFHYVEAGKPDVGLSGDDDLFQTGAPTNSTTPSAAVPAP